jgi:hypothetical protein
VPSLANVVDSRFTPGRSWSFCKGIFYLSFQAFSHLTRRKGTHCAGVALFAIVNPDQAPIDTFGQALDIPSISKNRIRWRMI